MDYVADLDDLIRQLPRAAASWLVGHSMGGSVCSTTSAPGPIGRFALALFRGPGAGRPDRPRRPDPHRGVDRRLAGRAVQGPADGVARRGSTTRLRPVNDDKLGEGPRAPARRGRDPTGSTAAWCGKHDPLAHDVRSVPVPAPDRDQVLAADRVPRADRRRRGQPAHAARRRARPAPGALRPSIATSVIEGAGHMIPRHQPARVAELILELAGVSSPGGGPRRRCGHRPGPSRSRARHRAPPGRTPAQPRVAIAAWIRKVRAGRDPAVQLRERPAEQVTDERRGEERPGHGAPGAGQRAAVGQLQPRPR